MAPRRPALIGAAALLLLAGGWFGGRAALRAFLPPRDSAPRVTHETVLQQVRDVAKLGTAEAVLRDVVTVEHTRLWSTKRALIVATGRVLAGIDLDTLGGGVTVTVDSVNHMIRVTLPAATVLSLEVTDLRTYDERSGLLNPWRPADRDAVQAEVRAQLRRTAESLEVLTRAEANARRLLQALLARDGYTVEVTVAPRSGGPPIGVTSVPALAPVT